MYYTTLHTHLTPPHVTYTYIHCTYCTTHTTLHHTTLHHTALHCTTLHCITPHYTVPHYIYCTALHCSDCTTLHHTHHTARTNTCTLQLIIRYVIFVYVVIMIKRGVSMERFENIRYYDRNLNFKRELFYAILWRERFFMLFVTEIVIYSHFMGQIGD